MVFPADWLLQLVISVVLLWGLGGAVATLLAPHGQREDVFLFAPFFGFGIVAGASSYLGFLQVPVQRFAWILLAASIAGLFFVRRPLYASLRLHWPVLAICLGAYLLAMSVLFALGYLTTVGGTIDGISYATRSEYLQTAGLVRPAVPPGQPFYGWVADHIDYVRVGDVYFVAVVGALAGLRSYQLLTAIAALVFALVPAAIYLLARHTLDLKLGPSLLAAGIGGGHNLLLWVVYDNFMSQAFAMGLFAVVLNRAVRAIDTLAWRDLAAFALLLSALTSVYPVYVVPVLAVSLVYAAIGLARGIRSTGRFTLEPVKRLTLAGLGVLALAAVFNGVALLRSTRELALMGTLMGPDATTLVGPGNIRVFVPAFVMSGLAAHANVAYQLGVWQVPQGLLVGGSLVAAGWVVLGWWRLAPLPRVRALVIAVVLMALAVQQRWLVNQPQGYPYGYFKMATLITIVLLPLFAAGAWRLLFLRIPQYAALPALMLFIALNGANTLLTIRYTLEECIVMEQDLIQVAQATETVPAGQWLWLDVEPGLKQNWIGYLLKDRPLRYREAPRIWSWVIDDDGELDSGYEYALVQRANNRWAGDMGEFDRWYDPEKYEVVWANVAFELRYSNGKK